MQMIAFFDKEYLEHIQKWLIGDENITLKCKWLPS
jgi:hypothetical protein